MSKWYEVRVTMTRIYIVEVADNEGGHDATRYATDESGPFDDATATELATREAVSAARRHADEILYDDSMRGES